MGNEPTPGKPTTRRYSRAEKEQAVRLVRQLRAETGLGHGADPAGRVTAGLRVKSERQWVKQAEIDDGEAPGVTTAEAKQVKELEKEVRELRRANAILKSGGCRTDRRRPGGRRARSDGQGGCGIAGVVRSVA